MEEREAPIIEAVRSGDFDEVLRLLEDGADPNVRDILGETALFEATAVGNIDMAVALLLAGADPCIESASGAMAQDMAESPVIKSLLENFSDLNQDEAATHMVAYKLLDPVVVEKVKACIKGRTAERAGQQEAASVSLLGTLCREDVAEKAAPQDSVEAADHGLAKLLEEEPLLVAVREGSLKMVKELLKQRANPDSLDLLGETPLYEAAASGNVRIAAVLLLADADPCHVSPRDSRAVDLAAEKPMRELLQFAAGTRSASELNQYNLVLNELDVAMHTPIVRYLKSRSDGALNMRPGLLDGAACRSGLNDHRCAEPPLKAVAPVRTDAKATLQTPCVPAAETQAKDVALSDDDESDEDVALLYGKSKSRNSSAPEVVADIKVVAKKAVGDQEVTISCRSNSSFGELKHLLAEQIGCLDQLSRLWLVHKGSSGVYASYKESEKVGNVREVLFLAPSV